MVGKIKRGAGVTENSNDVYSALNIPDQSPWKAPESFVNQYFAKFYERKRRRKREEIEGEVRRKRVEVRKNRVENRQSRGWILE